MPIVDALSNRPKDPAFPDEWIAYTKADADAAYAITHVKCTVAGNVALKNYKSGNIVVMPIAVGEIITGKFSQLRDTSTTATGLFVAYCTP